MMEEEYILNQERLNPQKEKNDVNIIYKTLVGLELELVFHVKFKLNNIFICLLRCDIYISETMHVEL